MVTPVLVILVAMVAGLALVAVCIILVMRGEDTQVDSEEKHDHTSASKSCIRRFVITEKAPTRAFSWLKAATTAFTFYLRHYAKWALTIDQT